MAAFLNLVCFAVLIVVWAAAFAELVSFWE